MGRARLSLLAACCVALAAPALAHAGNPAVTYQVNVAHTGVQADDSLVPPFFRRWQTNLGAPVSYPLIAGGRVFVTVRSATSQYGTTLYALGQRDGSVLWSRPIPGTYYWSAAAYDAGKVFVVNVDGYLQALAADTGAPLWATQLSQYLFSSPPTAKDGVVYVLGAGSGGTLYAVDEASGAVLATQPAGSGDHSSPTLSPDAVFVSFACNQAYAFARSSLSFLWHYSTDCFGGGGRTTVYADGRVYTRDFYGNLVLDAATGSLLRSWAPSQTSVPAPAIDSGTIFLLSGGVLSAEAAADGSQSWSFSGDGQLDTAPLVLATAQGRFVVEGSSSGMLYALRASDGGVAWQTNVGSSIPAPDEHNVSQPLTGLGAGEGLLVVPAGSTISAYGAADSTPPTIAVPSTITAKATSGSGAVVTYSVSVSDPDDAATVSCSPPSGSTFPIGVTTVACTASDASGNTSSASFLVVVSAPGAQCDLSRYPSSKGALNLKGANLSGCYLPGASLAAANATNASFVGAYLAGANLSSANLTQAQLQRAVLTGANLTGVKWVQTICPDGTNSNANGGTCIGHLG